MLRNVYKCLKMFRNATSTVTPPPSPCRSYVDSRGLPDTIAALTDLAGRCGYRFSPDPLLTQVPPPTRSLSLWKYDGVLVSGLNFHFFGSIQKVDVWQVKVVRFSQLMFSGPSKACSVRKFEAPFPLSLGGSRFSLASI